MNKNTIITAVVSLLIGAGGIFAFDATKNACDKLPDREVSVGVDAITE